MEQQTNTVQTAVESPVGTETPSKVETSAELSKEEIAELLELKKSKVHFQSIADSKISEATKAALEEKIKREMLEQQLNELRNPKPVERPLVEPVEPVQPPDYDPIDALTRGTSSYNYEQLNKKYIKDLALFNKELVSRQRQELDEKIKSFNELADTEKKKNEALQFENNFVAGLQTEGGLDETNARKAFKFFTSKESGDFKTLGQIWKTIEAGSPNKPTYQTPPPPSSGGGTKPNPSQFTKSNDTSWMYKTK